MHYNTYMFENNFLKRISSTVMNCIYPRDLYKPRILNKRLHPTAPSHMQNQA